MSHFHRPHRLLFSFFLFAVGLAFAAEMPEWKKALSPPDDGWKQTRQHFFFNNGAEPETLDPAIVTGVPEARLVEALFEGLVSPDPVTLEPRPAVAERWEISDDRLVYTFFLRETARWSDGKPLTATDFLLSWERALAPATASSYSYQLFPIRNAQPFNEGKIATFSEVGIEVLDARTLKVTLEAPCPYFLDLVGFHTLFPVPMAIVKEHGDRWVRAENIVSNGPFKLDRWDPRQQVTMSRNPHYWDRDFVKLDMVTAYPYDDLDTAYRLFLQGKIHYMDGVPVGKIEEVRRHPDYVVSPYLGIYFYRFNTTKPPFDDARVRRALSMGFDRGIITDQVLKAGQQPAAYLCPPVAGYQPVDGLRYDRDEARRLLREAGYGEGGKPFPTIEILYNTLEAHKKVAEAIAQQWKRNLDVEVSLRNSEWKVYLADQESLNYQICRASWIGDYLDPNTFFDLFAKESGNNRTGWSNPQYDAWLQATQTESDHQSRMRIFRQMETLLVEEECPIMPIYLYVCQSMVSERLCGWYPNIRDRHPLHYVWLEE